LAACAAWTAATAADRRSIEAWSARAFDVEVDPVEAAGVDDLLVLRRQAGNISARLCELGAVLPAEGGLDVAARRTDRVEVGLVPARRGVVGTEPAGGAGGGAVDAASRTPAGLTTTLTTTGAG
jgi:hypothetical protein